MAIPDVQAEIDLRQLWCEKTGGHYQDKKILRPMMAATSNVSFFYNQSTLISNPGYTITSLEGWRCRCGAEVWDSQ